MSIPSTPAGFNLHVTPSDALSTSSRQALRAMLDTAYDGDFSDTDWQHSLGGLHVWIEALGEPVSHASLVPRTLVTGGAPRHVGYVEAVATAAPFRRCGHASSVMRRINELIRQRYEIGALSTGEHGFYERLGWTLWRGPSFVMTAAGPQPTPDDDDGLMVFITGTSAHIELDGDLIADWRDGDPW